MAYRMDITGLNELYENIKELGARAPGVAAQALFEGARVVADAVSREMQGISTAPFKYAKDGKRKPSPEEKAAVMTAPHGVAKFRKNLHAVDTTVGFNGSGYVDVNFNHMSSKGRTNYKKQAFKGKTSMTTSTLKAAGEYRRGVQNQKPVGVIANAINSGTSFMEKQPFIRKAFSKSEKDAVAVIDSEIQKRIEQLLK